MDQDGDFSAIFCGHVFYPALPKLCFVAVEMTQLEMDLRKELEDLKNFDERSFNYMTENFYIMRSALRYFSQKKSVSFTSSRLSENFPLSVPVAGSCLNALEKIDVVSSRTKSNSPNVFMPQNVDLDRMEEIRKILHESHEIQEFQ